MPSPRALHQQFALAAQSDAQARRSRANSIQYSLSSDEARTARSSRSQLSHHSASSIDPRGNNDDELEEMAEPTESAFDWDPAAAHDALRDVRNQQLESLQSIIHSIAETHFERASSSSGPDSEITQILDDMFASLRRIGGHNAPLSPAFARSAVANQGGFNQMSDVERLVLLVGRFTLAIGNVDDAREAGLLANLNTLTHSLVESDRRMARAALESPPRTPRTLTWSESSHRRRSSYQQSQQHQQSQHSPQSSTFMSGSRGSWSSHGTLPTLSDEALVEMMQKEAELSSKARESALPKTKRTELLAETGLLSSVPEQQHIDGSVFDMATIRQSPSTNTPSTFSIETFYAHQPSASAVVAPQSPRSDQASRAASTALPNRKRFSVQTSSAASTSLPGYSSDAPGYDAVSNASQDHKKVAARNAQDDATGVETPDSDDLPQYDGLSGSFASDSKKPLETPTLLERRRAKLAAQHSAYTARTPEDLAMVQSSIDRMSTVMPQLENQRALSPEQQREAQLNQMMGRLAESNAKRLNDQRSEPPSFKPSRPAPSPRIEVERTASPAASAAAAQREMPKPAMLEVSRKVFTAEPESEMPVTPTTPCSQHSGSSNSRRGSSLLPTSFSRKLSIASIGNALRRASIYDTTKVKPKEAPELHERSATPPSQAATVLRRAATQDSRSKSDIAETLSSLFNEGTARTNGTKDSSANRLAAQTGFRAIDFADDTPRGRDASLNPRASCEEEDDSMLDDYSFATVQTKNSNHRLSVISAVPDSPHSPISMMSSGSSRRSSQMMGSNPATPTWPKSPLTPISPVAPKKATKATVTFAADTLQPPPSGRSRAASLQSQLRENGLSPLRPRKFPSPAPAPDSALMPLDSSACDPAVCASASTTASASTAVAATFAGRSNDLIVYSLTGITYSAQSRNNAADNHTVSATTTTAALPPFQSKLNVQLELEFFAEAQHTLGSISVLLWTPTQAVLPHMEKVELAYQLIEEDGGESRMLHITPVDPNVHVNLACAREITTEVESDESINDSGGGSGRGEKRKRGGDHVSSSSGASGGGRVQIHLPAAAVVGQSGNVVLSLGGAVSRLKLALTEAERRAGAEESRAEGMVEFPLSASFLSSQQPRVTGLGCAVCHKQQQNNPQKDAVVDLGKGIEWRALPSEGWEELVDAWMCHGDQELNRSLTETAVRFSSKIAAGSSANDDDRERGREADKKKATVWVGDTYFLLPREMVDSPRVKFESKDGQMVSTEHCSHAFMKHLIALLLAQKRQPGPDRKSTIPPP